MISDQLPSILHRGNQPAISMERALKQAAALIANYEELLSEERTEIEAEVDRINATLDDINLMLSAINRE